MNSPVAGLESALEHDQARVAPSPFMGIALGAADLPATVLERLESGLRDELIDVRLIVGRLLASAIWHGALIGRRWWQAWVDALHDRLFFDRALWVDMLPLDLEASGTLERGIRRWFADPTTQILLLRWRAASSGDPISVVAEECLAAFLRPELPAVCRDQFVDQFALAAELRWRLRMPGLLAEYALGQATSFSCASPQWTRVWSGLPVSFSPPPKKLDEEICLPADPTARDRWPDDEDLHKLIAGVLRRSCQNDHVRGINKRRNDAFAELSDLSPSQRCSPLSDLLRRWCAGLLKMPLAADGRTYRQSTASNYFGQVRANLFYLGCGAEDLLFDAAGLQEFYRLALERLPSGGGRNRLINALQAFARFLEIEHPELAGDVDWTNEYRAGEDGAVNLIGSADYDAALRCLPDRDAADIRLLRMALILGFRTGLRLFEIRGLTVNDIVVDGPSGAEQIELVVRRQRFVGLKTRWSRRVLPLHLLLKRNEDSLQCEVHEFLNWLGEAASLARLSGCPDLFVLPSRPSQRVPEKVGLLHPLNAILRHVTGDQSVTFGALRHSFVSALLTTMLLPTDGMALPLPRGFDDHAISPLRRRVLQAALIGEERLGQARLHAVSQLVGHAPVTTTLHHYAHLLDWCVGAYASRKLAQPGFTVEQAATLTGMETSAVRKAVQRSPAAAPAQPSSAASYVAPELLRSKRHRGKAGEGAPASVYPDLVVGAASRNAVRDKPFKAQYPVSKPAKLVTCSALPKAPVWLNWRLVLRVLLGDHGGRRESRGLQEIADDLGVPLAVVWNWVARRADFKKEWTADPYLWTVRSPTQSGGALPRPRHQASQSASRRHFALDDRVKSLNAANFPESPLGYDVIETDRLWSHALAVATAEWDNGLDVFRRRYDGHRNCVVPESWSEAREFQLVCDGLGISGMTRLIHRPGTGNRLRAENLATVLAGVEPPRRWTGTIEFRLSTGQTNGRGYAPRFVLTMLAITGCGLIARFRGTQRPTLPTTDFSRPKPTTFV